MLEDREQENLDIPTSLHSVPMAYSESRSVGLPNSTSGDQVTPTAAYLSQMNICGIPPHVLPAHFANPFMPTIGHQWPQAAFGLPPALDGDLPSSSFNNASASNSSFPDQTFCANEALRLNPYTGGYFIHPQRQFAESMQSYLESCLRQRTEAAFTIPPGSFPDVSSSIREPTTEATRPAVSSEQVDQSKQGSDSSLEMSLDNSFTREESSSNSRILDCGRRVPYQQPSPDVAKRLAYSSSPHVQNVMPSDYASEFATRQDTCHSQSSVAQEELDDSEHTENVRKTSSTTTDKISDCSSPVWVPQEQFPVRDRQTQSPVSAASDNGELKHVPKAQEPAVDSDPENETDHLLGLRRIRNTVESRPKHQFEGDIADSKIASRKKEVIIHEPAVLIEGVLFRACYLGSTQLMCEGRPTKASRMMQAQEAVSRIKAPEGERQPSTDVDLFISTEKIMVLNVDVQDILMDHPLRTISYIADIGNIVVLMARRISARTSENADEAYVRRTPKILCHVFESEEAQFIAQSIGQAFHVAYMEFLRQNGIDDPCFLREADYQEVLNAQEIFGDELELFARKETQKDVVIPKQKGEPMGLVIVESGWGSMLPTVVIANLQPGGPSARCNLLNIGDQIIAVNGISLVGLPLQTSQNIIKNVKNLTAVKMTVVHTTPVVEVRIKRPDIKYQLGFSVQNGVICSLLRGGIAERGGVRVGHRIIEINDQSVVAVAHEKIVAMLATAVGEIQMKTMPTSMFRLITGQEAPNYI